MCVCVCVYVCACVHCSCGLWSSASICLHLFAVS